MQQLSLGSTTKSFDQQDQLQAIDALRGYAILLVISVHSVGYVRELVWPVLRIFGLGFYGVQLFFIASAVTLLMSWNRGGGAFWRRSGKFLVRRFFMIAPFYYVAMLFYWFVSEINFNEFSLDLMISSLFFYNAWSPYLIPTVPGWTPVPGGWSISVEFCFYFIFPFLAVSVTNLRRSILFFIFALVLLVCASSYGHGLYPEISPEARDNFLYFWPPNHLVIFSLGFLLYHLIKTPGVHTFVSRCAITTNAVSAMMIFAYVAISFYGVRKFYGTDLWLLPTHLLLSICFVHWALFLIIKPIGWTLNSAIIGLGKVSFSAYILHFAVLGYSNRIMVNVWPFSKEGWGSVIYEIVFLTVALLITRFFAELSYRIIEKPFVELGKKVIERIFV